MKLFKRIKDNFQQSKSKTGKRSTKIGGSFAGIGIGFETAKQSMDVSEMLTEAGASANLVTVLHYAPEVLMAVGFVLLIVGAYKTGALKDLLPDLINAYKRK